MEKKDSQVDLRLPTPALPSFAQLLADLALPPTDTRALTVTLVTTTAMARGAVASS